jgi:hypothetical protein
MPRFLAEMTGTTSVNSRMTLGMCSRPLRGSHCDAGTSTDVNTNPLSGPPVWTPSVRFHDLRHSHVALLVAQGLT